MANTKHQRAGRERLQELVRIRGQREQETTSIIATPLPINDVVQWLNSDYEAMTIRLVDGEKKKAVVMGEELFQCFITALDILTQMVPDEEKA